MNLTPAGHSSRLGHHMTSRIGYDAIMASIPSDSLSLGDSATDSGKDPSFGQGRH